MSHRTMLALLLVLPALAAEPAAPPAPPPAGPPTVVIPVNPNAALKPPSGTVVFTHREPAVFPPDAFKQGISAGGCAVRAFFNEKGVAYRAVPMLCDSVWVESATTAAMKYTVQPFMVEGVPRKIQVDMVLVYTAGAPMQPPGTEETPATPPAEPAP